MLHNLFIKKLFSNKYNVIPYNLGIILTGFFLVEFDFVSFV